MSPRDARRTYEQIDRELHAWRTLYARGRLILTPAPWPPLRIEEQMIRILNLHPPAPEREGA